MKFFLSRRRPENRTIEYTAVFKAVWKAADIYTSSFSKTLHSHLHFLIFLDQNVCFRQCIDVLLAFAEINISVSILQDKMLSVFFPVIFIRIKVKSSLFFHTKDIIQLEEFTLPLMSCRFTYSNKASAIIYKLSDSSDDRFIDPVFTT